MSDENPEVFTGHPIGVAAQGKPRTANQVVDFNVAARRSSQIIKVGQPGVGRGLNGRNGGLTGGGIRWPFQANGHPRVIGKLREHCEEERIDPLRGV